MCGGALSSLNELMIPVHGLFQKGTDTAATKKDSFILFARIRQTQNLHTFIINTNSRHHDDDQLENDGNFARSCGEV